MVRVVHVGIRKEAVRGVETDYHFRPVCSYETGDVPPQFERVLKVAVGVAHEDELLDAENRTGRPLFRFPDLREPRRGHLCVLAALVARRDDDVGNNRAGARPACDRSGSHELRVVRMRDDDHSGCGYVTVDRR